jgi:putative transcriptional regulator
MSEDIILKNRVKELRARLNLRQSDLAREVDVTRQTILAIEKGRLNPSIVVSLKIAQVLGEPVGSIFYLGAKLLDANSLLRSEPLAARSAEVVGAGSPYNFG